MRAWLAAATTVLLAVACADPQPPRRAPERAGVVVASFDFDESRLLAEIYAQALEDVGVRVARELGLGPRELVLPALRQGLVDVVPEYAGSALDATAPGRMIVPPDASSIASALAAAVRPWGLAVLAPAAASNENVLAVPAGLGAEHDLRATSDLVPIARSLTLGGPPECPRRPRCLTGFADRYGLRFAGFVPLASADLVRRALDDGVVDVGVLFSTDAVLAGGDLVVLEDDRHLQPPDHVVPMVRSSVLDDGRVARALDGVSRRLTTANLRFLNWRLEQPGATVVAEARGWLVRNGIVAR